MTGLLVTGGEPPLGDLGFGDDPALTPFAGKYRFLDLALATLANSGVGTIELAVPHSSVALRAHALASLRLHRDLRRPLRLPARARIGHHGRASRLGMALAACGGSARTAEATAVVALLADHVLQVDVRELVRTHLGRAADVTLVAVPRPAGESGPGPVLRIGPDGTVIEVGAGAGSTPGDTGLVPAWSGDMIVRGAARALVASVLERATGAGDHDALATLCREVRVVAHDVFDGRVQRTMPYWHEPTTVEAYYDAHMNLCTSRPGLDLFNPAWPLSPTPSGLGPAKVVADAAGHPGQVLNALVCDGTVVRGGSVRNAVLGYEVLIEAGAEIEDSILLDGCRIGRHARIRRAIIGPGAVIGDEEQIGYERVSIPPARLLPSGLTLVPPAISPAVAVAAR